MTEPTVLDFEILVLEQYLASVKLALEAKRAKGLKDQYDEQKDLRNLPTGGNWRDKFIATYRS